MALKATHRTLSPALVCLAMKRACKGSRALPIILLLVNALMCLLAADAYACYGGSTDCHHWQECIEAFVIDSLRSDSGVLVGVFAVLALCILALIKKVSWQRALGVSACVVIIFIAAFITITLC